MESLSVPAGVHHDCYTTLRQRYLSAIPLISPEYDAIAPRFGSHDRVLQI